MSESEYRRHLFSVTSSVLQKLDECSNPEEFGGDSKEVEMLKGILMNLPSIISSEPQSASGIIYKSVFGLRDLLNEQLHPSLKPSWSDLVHPLAGVANRSIPDLWSFAYCALYPKDHIIQGTEFPQLLVLSLSGFKCEKLPDICVCSLRYLFISRCSGLRFLSRSNLRNLVAQLLSRARKLIIHNCALLDLSDYSRWNSLPILEDMKLIGLPKLTELPAGLQSARDLRRLTIGDCMSLRSIDQVLQHLHSLEELRVYNCPALSMAPNVFQSLTHLYSLEIRDCQNVTAKFFKPFISHIPQIIFDEHDDGCTHMQLSDKSSVSFAGQVNEVHIMQISQLVIQQKSPEVGGGGSSQVIAGYNTNGSGNQTNGDINIHTQLSEQQNVHATLNIHQLN